MAFVTVLVLATLAVGRVSGCLRQSYFRVQHITFVGVRHEPLSLVLAASGLESHPTMLDVNAATVKANLAQFAWIDSVRLTEALAEHRRRHGAREHRRRGRLQRQARAAVRGPARPRPRRRRRCTRICRRCEFVHPRRRHVALQHAPAARPRSSPRSCRRPSAPQVSIITEDDHGVVTLKMTTPVTFILGPRDATARKVRGDRVGDRAQHAASRATSSTRPCRASWRSPEARRLRSSFDQKPASD